MRACVSMLAVLAGAALAPPSPPQPGTRSPATFYVAPTGSPTGRGTIARPWDLATALAGAGGRIQAGDTIWLRGGRYRGAFQTRLTGSSERHIVFRQYVAERATIDGTLRAEGAYLTFWGFEIMQSDPLRTATYGLEARTNGGRFINLVIHDAGTMGVSFWTPGENAELYGCIVYNNGTHENLDHGVYVHNERGTKVLADNIFFNNLAYGIHLYAGRRNRPQRDVRLEGNIAFNNGTISRRVAAKGNILVGGEVPMSDVQVLRNILYFSGQAGDNLRLGYRDTPNGDAVVRENFVWGGAAALRLGVWQHLVLEGNTLGGARSLIERVAGALGPLLEARNVLYERSRVPPPPIVFVRPNRYEAGRAYVAVFAGRGRSWVKADLSGVLTGGQRYELRNVQDVFGAPVASGTYAGDSVSVPLGGVAPPLPLGRGRLTTPPPRTGPAFDVFLLTVRP